MLVRKAVWQHYRPDERTLFLLGHFRWMVNDCVLIGLAEGVTSLKALSLRGYKQLKRYDVPSCYRLCAISAASGILRNYRKAKRKNPRVKEPYARRLRLTTCYSFRVVNGELWLPFRSKERIQIPLTRHVQETLVGYNVRSVTLTEDRLSLCYAREIEATQPLGFVGVDMNLDNVTVAGSDGAVSRHDLSEATEVKAIYRDVRSHFRRNDVRIRRRISGKYGRKQGDKVRQILHHVSKEIVDEAEVRRYGIVMEKLTGMRKLYRKGNWQGPWYRGRMNSWSYGELQRQIKYKAGWKGLPVITVAPHGTSSTCSICGHKMKPEENRRLRCPSCGYTVDRDVNAARNILAKGALRFGAHALPTEAMVAASAGCLVRESAKSMEAS